MGPADRRKHIRFALRIMLTVHASDKTEPIRGVLMDLSAGGAFISAPVSTTPGAGAFIQFAYQSNRLCEATGHVLRAVPLDNELRAAPLDSEFGIAIKFAFANDELISFLRTLEGTLEPLRPAQLADIDRVMIRLA